LSRRNALGVSRSLFTATVLLLTAAVGCWEQWSDTWFPQMKRQKAVQAYELVGYQGQIQGFSPPDGAVPVTGIEPLIGDTDDAAANALDNPRPMSLASLENGRSQYLRYCATCHGADPARPISSMPGSSWMPIETRSASSRSDTAIS